MHRQEMPGPTLLLGLEAEQRCFGGKGNHRILSQAGLGGATLRQACEPLCKENLSEQRYGVVQNAGVSDVAGNDVQNCHAVK